MCVFNWLFLIYEIFVVYDLYLKFLRLLLLVTYIFGMLRLSVRKHLVLFLAKEGQNAWSFLFALFTVSMRLAADCSFAVFTFKARSAEALNTSIISIVLSIPWG